jgi:hypothetical protein
MTPLKVQSAGDGGVSDVEEEGKAGEDEANDPYDQGGR